MIISEEVIQIGRRTIEEQTRIDNIRTNREALNDKFLTSDFIAKILR